MCFIMKGTWVSEKTTASGSRAMRNFTHRSLPSTAGIRLVNAMTTWLATAATVK
jgi:hypothetical protein